MSESREQEAAAIPARAVAVQRRLAHTFDPFSLFGHLCDEGRRADTALFERSDGATLLLQKAAVRVESRSRRVVLDALSANGRALLEAARPALNQWVTSGAPDRLVLEYPPLADCDAEARLLAPAPLHALRALTQLGLGDNPFAATALGIVGFDYAAMLENLPDTQEDRLNFPDYVFWIAESLILFEPRSAPLIICTAFGAEAASRTGPGFHDAVERLAALTRDCEAAVQSPSEPPPPFDDARVIDVDLDDQTFCALVTRLREEIARGEMYQIVLSRTFTTRCSNPLSAFAALRQAEQSPYKFYLNGGDWVLLGASPETSVRLYREGSWKSVEVKPIAGTRPRGRSPDEDDRFEAELRFDEKELAEHMMLVDLARNDVARISISGTRRVAKLLTVERYARVMHLVSSVTGKLAIGFDALDALAACLNVGTLSGAPRLRATELLREVERTKRGPYGGAVGWLNGDGLMDTAVIIRSALVHAGLASVRAGAGIVHDSDPQAEADETRRKASALLSVIAAAEARA